MLDEEPFQQTLPHIDGLEVACYRIPSRTSKGAIDMRIPVLHVKYVGEGAHKNLVLLHSHANSTDIGLMMDAYLDLSFNLKVDVVAYDYSGYGLSSCAFSALSDIEMFENILSVYRFTLGSLKYAWN